MGEGQASQSLWPAEKTLTAHPRHILRTAYCRPRVGEINPSWGRDVFTGACIEAEVRKMRFRGERRWKESRPVQGKEELQEGAGICLML